MATERFCPECFQSFAEDIQFCPEHGKALVVMENLDDDLAQLVDQQIDGRYRIKGVLGQGGMGMVFKAEQTSVGREVALKVLNPIFSKDATAVKRFFREAKLASSLSHPNTVTIYDFARSDTGLLYISMEYVEGIALNELIESDAPLPIHRALGIVSYITDSLGEAHHQGLVHRDLKPPNVIIQQRFGQSDFARVLDFGIAKTMGGSDGMESLTSTGSVCGTPAYMSPEQAMGKELDGRSDIYALGCILYEMLTGQIPFPGATPVQIMAARLAKEFQTVLEEDAVVDIPEDVKAVIRDMTYSKKEDRLNAVELRRRLSGLGFGSGTNPEFQARLDDDVMKGYTVEMRASEPALDIIDPGKSNPKLKAIETGDTLAQEPASLPGTVETSPTSAKTELQRGNKARYATIAAVVILLSVGGILWSQGSSSDTNTPDKPTREPPAASAAPTGAQTPAQSAHAAPGGGAQKAPEASGHEVYNTHLDVKAHWLALRSGAGAGDKYKTLAAMTDGTQLTVLSKGHGLEKRWWKVRIDSGPQHGKEGFALSNWIRRTLASSHRRSQETIARLDRRMNEGTQSPRWLSLAEFKAALTPRLGHVPTPNDRQRATALKRRASLMTRQDPQASVNVLLQAIQLDPTLPAVYEALSYSLYFAKRYQEGVLAGKMAIQRASTPLESARSQYNTGLNLEKLGNRRGAIAAYKKSLSYREHPEVRRHLDTLQPGPKTSRKARSKPAKASRKRSTPKPKAKKKRARKRKSDIKIF